MLVKDPFTVNFVIDEMDDPKLIEDLIKMCDVYSQEWGGDYIVGRGKKGSLSGQQTRHRNPFEDDRFPVMDRLKPHVERIVNEYFKANIGFKIPVAYQMQGWFNKLDGMGAHEAHTHGTADLVINLYLSCPTGKDSFGKDVPSQIAFLAPNHITNCRSYIQKESTFRVYPKAGTIVASPPMYYHFIPNTYSTEWRRSLSINIVEMIQYVVQGAEEKNDK